MYKILFLLLLPFSGFAQDLFKINLERHRLQGEGMVFLTGWAAANIAGGSAGYFLAKDKEWKYFHEMNVFWNTVNLGLGVAALASAPKQRPDETWTLEKSKKAQRKVENIFLINTGLDLVYMGAGLSMSLSAQGSKNPDRLRGYGNALLLQGGFLFVFDGIEYLLHRNNGWRLFESKNISLQPRGMGLVLSIEY